MNLLVYRRLKLLYKVKFKTVHIKSLYVKYFYRYVEDNTSCRLTDILTTIVTGWATVSGSVYRGAVSVDRYSARDRLTVQVPL